MAVNGVPGVRCCVAGLACCCWKLLYVVVVDFLVLGRCSFVEYLHSINKPKGEVPLLVPVLYLCSSVAAPIQAPSCPLVNYGNFMHGLMMENVQLNRKVLSELSMHEPYSFKALVDVSRSAFPGNKKGIVPPKKEGLAIVL